MMELHVQLTPPLYTLAPLYCHMINVTFGSNFRESRPAD